MLPAAARVTFTRLEGSVLGTIANEIEESEDGELLLSFSFARVIEGVERGSEEEHRFAARMEKDYFGALEATLGFMRRSLASAAG